MSATEPTIHRHLEPDALELALRADVRAGLTTTPKTLPPKWFYDERGSKLFDEITRLAEYYPTRTERSILVAPRRRDRRAAARPETLVELGSGTSEKTRLLLDALRWRGTLQGYVGFDVDESTLSQAGEFARGRISRAEPWKASSATSNITSRSCVTPARAAA